MTVEHAQDFQDVELKPKDKLLGKKSAKESKDPKKPVAVLKKLDAETSKLLQSLNDKANKKTYGRKIRDSEILFLGLSLIKPENIADLQKASLSARDRVAIAHEEYQKTNPKVTLDQFLEKLLQGEIPAVVKT